MRPIQYFLNSSELAKQDGFTLLEFLVAMLISAGIFALIAIVLVFQSDRYLDDISRVRIQQNLRSALDVISMNVRQAGEGLDNFFPALVVTASPTSIAVRRKIVHEVMNACQEIDAGAIEIFVSDHLTTGSRCLPVNIAASVTSWTAFRVAHNNAVPVYVYDRVAKMGEFVTYSAETLNGSGDNTLTVSPTTRAYAMASTNIYGLEEFLFQLDTSSKTLQLFQNGDLTEAQDVAYKVKTFAILLTYRDNTTGTALGPTDTKSWKDLKKVKITLEGEESWKSRVFTRSVSGEYFPRNILSH